MKTNEIVNLNLQLIQIQFGKLYGMSEFSILYSVHGYILYGEQIANKKQELYSNKCWNEMSFPFRNYSTSFWSM